MLESGYACMCMLFIIIEPIFYETNYEFCDSFEITSSAIDVWNWILGINLHCTSLLTACACDVKSHQFSNKNNLPFIGSIGRQIGNVMWNTQNMIQWVKWLPTSYCMQTYKALPHEVNNTIYVAYIVNSKRFRLLRLTFLEVSLNFSDN